MWNLEQAVALCKLIHPIAEFYKCYPALTGGCLYREGERKDLDILFYRNRQTAFVDYADMLEHLRIDLGLESNRNHIGRWCVKANYQGKGVDLFFPEGWGDHPELDDYENPVDNGGDLSHSFDPGA